MNRAESCFPQPSTAPVTPTWRWEVTEGHANIDLYADFWRELAHRSACSPIGDAWWTRAHWRAFVTCDQQPAVHALFDSSRLVAVLPLIKQGRVLRGWRTFTNGHTPYWMTAVDASEATIAERILDHLLTSSDFVELDLLHEQGNLCTALIAAARAQGLPTVQKKRDGDTLTELFGPWDAFRRTLSKNLETKTSRAYRQLQSCGKVSFSMIDSNDQLAGVLEECFAVEARGWKGLRGTPIQSRPDTLQFYTELAHAAAAHGELALYTLRLNSQLIAFEFCLRARRRIDMLKLSYEPEFTRYAPGNILRYLIFQQEIEKGEIDTYHYGQQSEWKLRWADRVEPTCCLRIYNRRWKGRLAYRAGWVLDSYVKNQWTRAIVRGLRRRRLQGERKKH